MTLNLDQYPRARALLLEWYEQHRRDLPWRRTKDPYAILVSELMLQQTRVETVIPYYHRFLERFPDFEALAAAPEQAVLKAWEGLGYYRRARHLQETARQIVALHQGCFPRDKSQIDELRGVGPYTSAAVASFAFNLAHACLDGNVMRVLSRLFAQEDDISTLTGRKSLQKRADEWLDPQRPGDFNQAMMELGATICIPRQPLCLICPIATACETRRLGMDPHSLPVKSKRTAPSSLQLDALFLFTGKRFLLGQRQDSGLMAGCWELPAKPGGEGLHWCDWFSGQLNPVARKSDPILHKFTHLHVTYALDVFESASEPKWKLVPDGYKDFVWVTAAQALALPTTKVFRLQWPMLADLIGA